MAATGTPTPNLGLRIPQGTDPASVDDINYNSNLLDTKLGAVGNESVQDQIDALNSNKLPATSYSTYSPVTLGDFTAIYNGFLLIQVWVNASKTFTVKVGNTKLFEHFAGTAMNATAQIPVKAGTTLSITTDDSISSSVEIGKFVAT